MDEYNKIVSLYNKLCTERNDSSFWASNILDATAQITEQIVWQNFYAYMANEHHIYTAQWQNSLGEEVDKGLVLPEDNRFETKTVQNGCVTYIKMTPNNLITSSKDNGKQMDRVFKTIPEETPEHESKTGDEKCEF